MAQKYRVFGQVKLETSTKMGTGTPSDIGDAPDNNHNLVFGEQ
jgi:hypothetical protein